jgi:hypothetical protein
VIERSREAESFLATAHVTDPTTVSWCEGWTAQEVVAHVAGIAVEVRRHLEPFLSGDRVPETRSFEEREAPLRDTGYDQLLQRLDTEEGRMRGLVAEVLASDPDAVIPWTGREMAVAKFIPHLRNEHALHRWDLVGDDLKSLELLGQTDLVEHSVGVLGGILLVAGRAHDPAPDSGFRISLEVVGQPDLHVVVDDGRASLAWAEDASAPRIEMDAAARHLFIWGRRPEGGGRMHSHLSQPQLARLQTLLSGY